jgi:periplasmic copper chaperone A
MKVAWLLVAASVALVGCQQKKALSVSDGWVRLSAVRANPSAAYFTLHGGPKDATLISVTSPVAIRAEMHESMNHGGMMTMTPLKTVAVPANGTVSFAPGGKHVMLYFVNPGVKPGWTMDLRYSFSDGTVFVQRAKVVGPGDPAPEKK